MPPPALALWVPSDVTVMPGPQGMSSAQAPFCMGHPLISEGVAKSPFTNNQPQPALKMAEFRHIWESATGGGRGPGCGIVFMTSGLLSVREKMQNTKGTDRSHVSRFKET